MKKTDDHKTWIGQIFDSVAPEYGKNNCYFFDYFGKRLVDLVPIKSGQSVLDVATGKGAILFPVAEIVGPQGNVIGIDISQQMLNETSKEVQKKKVGWIKLGHMDAENLDFPEDSFDIVFCGFALFFFPSVQKALSEFKRVLKPGGTLAVSTWGEDSKLDILINEEMSKVSATNTLAISPLWTDTDLRQELEKAHFHDIQISEETQTFIHGKPEEWWNSLWTHGPRARLEQLTPQQLAIVKEKIVAKAKAKYADHITEELQVFYGIAQKKDV